MSDLTNCASCGEEVTRDSDFCPHCGVLFIKESDVYCDSHPKEAAKGICIICRKTVCEECGVNVSGRIFCLEHQEVEVQQDWAEVFRSTEISEAELVKSILESVGHKLLVQNFNSIGFVWGGGGDSALSRSNIGKPARVFVPIPEFLDAIRAIEEWRSSCSDSDKSENT